MKGFEKVLTKCALISSAIAGGFAAFLSFIMRGLMLQTEKEKGGWFTSLDRMRIISALRSSPLY